MSILFVFVIIAMSHSPGMSFWVNINFFQNVKMLKCLVEVEQVNIFSTVELQYRLTSDNTLLLRLKRLGCRNLPYES